MTLGSVARVAMEYRQHLQMLNSFSKLTADLASDSKAAKLGSPHCDTLSSMDKLNLDKVSLFGHNKYTSPTLAGQNIPGYPTGNSLLDIASLMLFGTHALPVRLKILLDRLVCNLEQEDLVNLLHAFGWTYEDYSRGYMIQDSMGNLLTKWIIISKEEEVYIIQLFLKFAETKTIAQNFVLNEPIFNQYSDNSAILANKFKDYKEYELKKLVDCTNANLLPKNSPFSLNSLKSPVLESNTQKNHFDNNNKSNNKVSSNHCDSEDKPNRSHRQSPETEKAQATNKQTSKAQLSPPVNHRLSTSPKSEKVKDKSASSNHQNSLSAPINSLSKLENLIPNFEYRKKEPKSEPGSDPFLGANVSAASATTNPLFPLTSPLNFNLLNPAALLADPSKYPNAADLCKIDLTNPAAAAAFSAAASAFGNKNLDFSSFNKAESACNSSNANSNNCAPTSDAINLTQNSKHNSSSNHMDKKANKHLRKSSAPIKRRWDPTILSSLTTNPSTGKKRVQCNVCFKTFCDKGALKIHFSAVHLREMHKCTVDGCSMMFSSRRSRNRHSANPNPKLHTPNFRRKINPHDGRTANPYPLIPTQASSLFGISGVNGGLISNFDTLNGSFSDHSPKGDYGLDFNSMSSRSSRGSHNDELDDAYMDDDDMDDDNGDMDDDDDICIDLSVKDDTHKSQRKRKNFNPIKFNSSHNNGNCDLDNDLENSEQYQYLSTSTDGDDDDDLSSDAESTSKQIKLSGDIENAHESDENHENADTDIDEADSVKANHQERSPTNHALDSGDELEVADEDGTHH